MRELFPTTLKCVFQIRHSPSLFIFERFILVTNSLVNTIALLCSQSVYSPFKNKKKRKHREGKQFTQGHTARQYLRKSRI